MSEGVRARYDPRMLRLALLLVAASEVVGCAAPRKVAPVGSQHSAYAGLPEYLESASRQQSGDAMKKLAAKRHGGTAPIHLSAPASDAAPEAPPGEGPSANPAGEAPAGADPAPPVVDPPVGQPSDWQPQIVTPGP